VESGDKADKAQAISSVSAFFRCGKTEEKVDCIPQPSPTLSFFPLFGMISPHLLNRFSTEKVGFSTDFCLQNLRFFYKNWLSLALIAKAKILAIRENTDASAG
jgi:hypothetical protein